MAATGTGEQRAGVGRASTLWFSGPLPFLAGLLPLAVLLALWQLLGHPRSVPFPPPSAWVEALIDLAEGGRLLGLIGTTAWTFLLGLLVASVLGIVVGLAVGVSGLADRATSPLFEFVRSVPAPVIVPVALLLFGIGPAVNIGIVAFAAVWPVLFSTASTVRSIPPTRRDVARSMQLSRRATVLKVLLPSIVPGIAVGIRLAAPISLVVALAVEFITGSGGIGAELLLRERQYDSASVYALVLVVGAMALVLNTLVILLERAFTRGR